MTAVHNSTRFRENNWKIRVISFIGDERTNKRTDTGENITSLAEVIIEFC